MRFRVVMICCATLALLAVLACSQQADDEAIRREREAQARKLTSLSYVVQAEVRGELGERFQGIGNGNLISRHSFSAERKENV